DMELSRKSNSRNRFITSTYT
ncbi:unnamed protein product, partial [Allacma fusca]